MSVCDLCNVPISPNARMYSSSTIKRAVRDGLRPPISAFELGAAFGMSKAQSESAWITQVMQDTSDWMLCHSCADSADSYLGNTMIDYVKLAAAIVVLLGAVVGFCMNYCPSYDVCPSNEVGDTQCVGKEKAATVNGKPIGISSWQSDCAYADPKNIWGKTVVISTWGIVMESAGSSVNHACIAAPGIAFKLVDHSSLFAGYSNKAGACTAYKTSVPNGPKPCSLYAESSWWSSLINWLSSLFSWILGWIHFYN